MSLQSLNPSQREAVEYMSGPVLVLAGAGSGKTRVITYKIAELIHTHGIEPRHIAAVTFTNKAAREMKARISSLLSAEATKGLRISTFHTLGLNIIRRELSTLGYRKGFSIYDDQDSMAVLTELSRGESEERIRQFRNQISRWKSECTEHAEALKAADDPLYKRAAELYEAYDRHLQACNAVDFDDLLFIPVRLFKNNEKVLERWRSNTRYLLVDEYQDTNSTQYELVKQLVGDRGCLTVVGDDDQSIYSWRGAQPENLNLLATDYPELKLIKLEQNYRSMGCILKAANQLISNNPHVFEKTLWSALSFGEPMQVIRAANEEREAEKVVNKLIHHKFTKLTNHGDYAILYRGNHQSRLFERALREFNIPYYLSGGTSFFAYTEIKDIMGYLRVLANPDDDNAMLRIINTPRREIGPGTVEKLVAFSHEKNCSLYTACHDADLDEALSTRALGKVRKFADWLARMSYQTESEPPITVVKQLLNEIDYSQWLQDTCPDEKAAERRMDNVLELVEWLERLSKRKNMSDATLGDLVARLTLLDILDRDDEQEGDNVHLMTLHAAKGLEFPHVFMVGMEEEILPHRSSIEEGNIEEERRLAYVGITRAQRTLTFSYATRRKRFGEMIECEPSRFLDELPDDVIERESKEKDPEAERVEAASTIDSLRAMLQK